MFFDQILLHHQYEGRLGYAWIAATLGIKRVKKEIILKLDVVKICDDIIRYLSSESTSPRARFSLRLSSFLVFGTIIIQHEKAKILLDEIIHYMETPMIPPTLRLLGRSLLDEQDMFATPPTPTLTKRKKRVRKGKAEMPETPESQLEQFVQQIVSEVTAPVVTQPEPQQLAVPESVLARTDDITLRESLVEPQAGLGIEELGPLGTMLPAEEEEIERVVSELDILKPIPEPEVQPSVPQIPESMEVKELQVQSSSSSEPSAPQQIVVVALVHAPAEEPAEVEIVPERVETRPPTIERIEVEERIAPTVEQIEVDESVKKKGETAKLMNQLFITRQVRKKKKIPIDRCEQDDLELVPIERCPLPEFRIQPVNFTKVLESYFVGTEEELASVRRSAVSSLQMTPGIQVETPLMPSTLEPRETPILPTWTPVVSRKRKQLIREPSLPTEMTVEETVALAGDYGLPTKVPRLDDLTVEPPSEELVTVTPAEELTEKERQQHIINMVVMSERPLTIEDVAEKPLNKLNVARCFNDLLILCKSGYVDLISDDDLTPLRYIKKGRKMFA